jgi:hypothetical protein
MEKSHVSQVRCRLVAMNDVDAFAEKDIPHQREHTTWSGEGALVMEWDVR